MTLTRPRGVPAGFINPDDDRKMWGGIVPREGLFPDPITTAAAGVAFAGSGWGVSARAFGAALRRGTAPFVSTYGTAFSSNDGTVANAWTIPAAPGAGSRIDLLCIRARDTVAGDSAAGAPTDGPGGAARTGLPEFVVVTGTAGTPGVRPALPAGYEEVAQITTPSGAASTAGSTIVQTYGFAHVIGGTLYFRTLAALLAYTNTAYLLPGFDAVALDQPATRYVWTGTRWAALSASAGILPSGGTPIVNGTMGKGGRIDFSAVAFVSLNGLFSSDFDEYEIEWEISARTGAAVEALLLRAAGADVLTNYAWRRTTSSPVAGLATTAGGSQASWNSFAVEAYEQVAKSCRLIGPARAAFTKLYAGKGIETNGTSQLASIIDYVGHHELANVYDGLTLSVPSGTMTGWIRVRGIA